MPRVPTFVSRIAGVALLAAIAIAGPAAAKTSSEARGPTILAPDQGGFTQSLGLPPVYKGQMGLEVVGHDLSAGSAVGFRVNAGLFRDLGSPVIGMAGIGLQGYAGVRSDKFDGGGRALFTIPSFGLNLGVDYDGVENAADFLLGLGIPIRRGGVVGNASSVYLRWIPARNQTLSAGLDWPLWGPNLGATRNKHDAVTLDRREPARLMANPAFADLAPDLAQLRERATWIARLSQPFQEVTGADPRRAMQAAVDTVRARWAYKSPEFPHGRTLNEEIRVYHETLDQAFERAIGVDANGPSGPRAAQALAKRARRVLLEDVIAPYNAYLGQRKEHDDLTGYIARAQSQFARTFVTDSLDYSRAQASRALWVFQTLCDIVEANRRELRARWEDSRFVWLPLDWALTPEDHDSQAELNELLELCSGHPFTNGNLVHYVLNEEFQGELARSIQAAEDYHVLWIHDFRGYNDTKEPDRIAYTHVVGYLTALTRRVREYDRTGKIPVYMIFLDQHYFEINKSRLWMPLLRDPLGTTIRLPANRAAWETEIRALQDSLRVAVRGSTLLQLEASQYGKQWLKNRIRIHINITNPADQSFVSRHVAGILPIPDNMMRDHRKIAFYDVTEADPYRGAALFTGMGVGEHYVGSGWEDRAIRLQGPGALAVKAAARELLEVQGFAPDEIPVPLRPVPLGHDYQAKVARAIAEYPAELVEGSGVLQLHNETGFETKPIDAAKAVLYSMMPTGSVLRVPDSLWQNYLYASLLAGSALRGCRVAVIAPRQETAPSSAGVTMARAHGLLGRLIVFQGGAAAELDAEGGYLHVGIYDPHSGVRDLAARFEQAINVDVPWADKSALENPEFVRVVRGVRAQLDSLGYHVRYLAQEDSTTLPKLHLKANLFASRAAWDSLIVRPEVARVFREYVNYMANTEPDSVGSLMLYRRSDDSGLRRASMRMLENYVQDLSPAENESRILLITIGSANMDCRSMVMDGEVMLTTSGFQVAGGMMDFLLLTGLCDWPATPEDLDRVLAPPSGMTRTMAGLMKISL